MPAPSPHRASTSKGEKLAQRLSYILALLHQGDSIDKPQLAHRFGVDMRTIDRDLGQRLRGIAERNAEGRWQLTHDARSTIPAKQLNDYARLAGTEHLFPDGSLRYLLAQLQTSPARRPMRVQPVPHEDLPDEKGVAFSQLEAAIAQRHECRFRYKGKARHAQPYRLLHKSGVWYLAAVEGGKLKNFSVGLIQALQVNEASRFPPDPAHHDYIDRKDDVWFTQETTEVLLRVAPEVAHYFARRALLPGQQQRPDADGSLLVTAHISHINQLLPVVRYWLPNVRIVKPVEWHEVLLEGLKEALTKWKPQ